MFLLNIIPWSVSPATLILRSAMLRTIGIYYQWYSVSLRRTWGGNISPTPLACGGRCYHTRSRIGTNRALFAKKAAAEKREGSRHWAKPCRVTTRTPNWETNAAKEGNLESPQGGTLPSYMNIYSFLLRHDLPNPARLLAAAAS